MRQFLTPDVPLLSVTQATGGFSGDIVLQVKTRSETYCLRSGKLHHWSLDRVRERSRWLLALHHAGIPVAVPLSTRTTLDVVFCDQELFWQLEPWLPGTAAGYRGVTPPQLRACMQRLAELHLVSAAWTSSPVGGEWFSRKTGPSPGIGDRRKLIASWTPQRIAEARRFIRQGPQDHRACSERLVEIWKLLSQILDRFERMAETIDRELEDLERLAVPLFPCLRDLWSAHVLFEGERVSGFIDPAATRTEHVAADLSRLLGSYWGDDRDGWSRGLSLYQEVRPLSAVDLALIQAYDRSAILLSGLTWLRRFQDGTVPYQTISNVADRIKQLASRSLGAHVLPH